jgi:competence protein ComEC
LCLTSVDAGAVGGASYILENFHVGELWTPVDPRPKSQYNPALAALESAAGAGVVRLNPGSDDMYFGDARVRIIEHGGSYTLILIYGRFKFVYPGFSDRGTARRAVRLGTIKNATVLKIPGRGTVESHVDGFASVANPVLGVISTKRGGKTEKPAPAVIKAFEGFGSDIIVTADRGSVVVESDGETVCVRTAF